MSPSEREPNREMKMEDNDDVASSGSSFILWDSQLQPKVLNRGLFSWVDW